MTVSELVRADYRLADVFKKWNINYCCGGNQLLSEACRLQQLDQTVIEAELQQAQQTVLLSRAVSFDDWPVDFLADYIVHVHHAYIKTITPKLEESFASFVQGHQKKYPHLTSVHELFKKLVALLNKQAQYEEEVIFPYVKQVNNALKRKESYGAIFVRTMHKSLGDATNKMRDQTASLLTLLREATKYYHFPADACTNHQVFYHKLKAFDADLVQHTYLEHNILFSKVLKMEHELLHG
jgi:regulator of cell morphogenesis and NO signaling